MSTKIFTNIIIEKEPKHKFYFDNEINVSYKINDSKDEDVIVIEDSDDDDKKDVILIVDEEEDCKIIDQKPVLEKPHACTVCDKRFTHKSNLYTHKKVHNPVRETFPCAICGRSFLYKCSLKLHVLSHTKPREYRCKSCLVKFENEASLKAHELRTHTIEKNHVCDVCGNSFSTWSGLVLHKRTHGGKQCICPTCGRGFKFKNHLLLHQRSHKYNHEHQCEICLKSFKTHSQLVRHGDVHSGHRYPCKDCTKSFSTEAYLRLHARMHKPDSSEDVQHVCCAEGGKSAPKTFVCNVCLKKFKQRAYLNIHKMIHTGDYKHFCSNCKKGFPFPSRLIAHEAKCIDGKKKA